MPFVRSFDDFAPPARFDGLPFTQALIQEAAASTGPWSTIETITFPDPDPTPSAPRTRDFTTNNALLEEGWYRIVWRDAEGGEYVGSPVRFPPPSGVLPPGLSLDELKDRLDKQLDGDDDKLTSYLLAAFEQAQAPPPFGAGRLLVPNPAGEGDPDVVLSLTLDGRRRVRIPDARSLSLVTADGETVAADNYSLLSSHGHIVQLDLYPYSDPWRSAWVFSGPYAPRFVELTGRFGFLEIPPPLKEAIYTLAARAHYEEDARFADTVALAEGSGVQAYYRQLPASVKLAFRSYAVGGGVGLTL